MNKILGTALTGLVAGLLSIAPATGHTVNVSGLNVRTGPGTGYGVVRTLSRGTEVNTVSTYGSWTKINSPVTGWVYSAYLSNTPHGGGGGSTSGMSAAGFINLPGSGYGWYSNTAAYRRWGVPRMVYGLITMGRAWTTGYPGVSGRVLVYSDISLQNGGYFYPHVSHRHGVDVDVSPVTTSGSAGYTSVGWSNYSTWYTQKYVNLIRRTWSVNVIFHNNSRIWGVLYWPGHYNHLHIRIY